MLTNLADLRLQNPSRESKKGAPFFYRGYPKTQESMIWLSMELGLKVKLET